MRWHAGKGQAGAIPGPGQAIPGPPGVIPGPPGVVRGVIPGPPGPKVSAPAKASGEMADGSHVPLAVPAVVQVKPRAGAALS